MMRNLYGLLVVSLFVCSPLFGAEITKVKGTNALVDLKGEPAADGDSYFAIGSDGKRHAIVEIAKVKGDKAIVHIIKGKADAGMTLEKRAAGSGGSGANSSAATPAKKSRKSGGSAPSKERSYWGVLGGFSMDTMSVQVNNGITGNPQGTAALSGSSFSAMGLFDYELFPQIWFRGLGGIEGFSVSGSAICGALNNQACNASMYYISMDFLGRYVFASGNYRPWAGAGIALMFPASKSATALSASSISNTSVIQVAAGLDWFISPTMYIPIQVEYGLLPKSNEVEASWIEIRAGLAFPFD